jgi:hypothetical protein
MSPCSPYCTWLLSVYVISTVIIVEDPRGLVILLVGWLEGASSSVQHAILGS